jgi:hypothetical protein
MAEPRQPIPRQPSPPRQPLPRQPIEVTTEPEEEAEPIQINWTSPPFLVAYGLVGLLCLWLLYKWVFGPARNPNLVRVRGTVTLGGKPFGGAFVTFHPATKEGSSAVGATDRFGKFNMETAGLGKGVLIGEYRVTVTKLVSEEKTMTPDEAKEYTGKTGKPPPEPKVTNQAPAQYANVQNSGLTATVKRGGGQFKFDLQ